MIVVEELFSSNLFAIYIIACITVISYTNFRENQRMFLLYLFAYATAFFQIFRISYSLALLLITTFVFLEYLTEDIKKLSLITKLRFKICDYIFMMIFQYHFIYVFCAFLILHLSHYNNFYTIQNLLQIVSAIPLWCGIPLSISQPFKIKSITEIKFLKRSHHMNLTIKKKCKKNSIYFVHLRIELIFSEKNPTLA